VGAVVTWIGIGIVVLGLVILALVAWPVLVRLLRLRRAVEPMLRRQAEAAELQRKTEILQERLLELQERADAMQERRSRRARPAHSRRSPSIM
jgi:biopolymer transport protein ExbB/TolQ